MEIKHMPYGLHWGEDCGFQRIPAHPLAGDRVRIGARLTGLKAEAPLLRWTVDGKEQPAATGELHCRAGDDRPYATFTLRLPNTLCTVAYCICAGQAHTQWFQFATLCKTELTFEDIVRVDQACCRIMLSRGALRLSMLWQDSVLRVYGGDAPARDELPRGSGNILLSHWGILFEVKRFTQKQLKLFFPITVHSDRDGAIYAIVFRQELAGIHVYGLGERFDQIDQQGASITLRVEEYFGHQGRHSYLPVPLMMTEAGVGLYNENLGTVQVAFEPLDGATRLTIEQATPPGGLLFSQHLFSGSPVDMLEQYHGLTGKAALPPPWVFGLWISANGWSTQAETLHQLEMLKKHDLPATAIVLEAWSDEKTFYLWNDADYSLKGGKAAYTLEDMHFPAHGRWPNPKQMIQAFRQQGIHTMLWQIPVIKRAWEGSIPQLDADEAYAISQGYCVMQADGQPYRITEGWFSGSLLLDFTNEKARAWWFAKRRYLLDMGVAGFKTDGGEFLFDEEARLHNGMAGAQAHNAYPLQYIKAYHDFGGVTFSRAGYAGAQTMPVHWAGDQWSTWEALRSQLCAGLSAGLSGIPFWSFDIAGFAGKMPSAELYLRAVALGAFCPVMQWHSEPRGGQYEFTAQSAQLNDRSPWNIAACTKDARVLPAYRRLAKLRMRLMDYLYSEAQYAVQTSRPLMAHLMVDFTDDAVACTTEDAFMLGRELLVAPVLTQRQTERTVYLPKGEWVELFSNKTCTGEQTFTLPCPVGSILVFARAGESAMRMSKLFAEVDLWDIR